MKIRKDSYISAECQGLGQNYEITIDFKHYKNVKGERLARYELEYLRDKMKSMNDNEEEEL